MMKRPKASSRARDLKASRSKGLKKGARGSRAFPIIGG
jgi:hypothetical protein